MSVPRRVLEMMAIDDVFGRVPVEDFNRKLNEMKYAIWRGDEDAAMNLAYEAEGFGNILLSTSDGDVDGLEDLFNEIRVYLRTRSFLPCKEGCKDPISDIQTLMVDSGYMITPVI